MFSRMGAHGKLLLVHSDPGVRKEGSNLAWILLSPQFLVKPNQEAISGGLTFISSYTTYRCNPGYSDSLIQPVCTLYWHSTVQRIRDA